MKRFFFFLSVFFIGTGVVFLFPVQAQIQEEDDQKDTYFVGVVKEISTVVESDPLFTDQQLKRVTVHLNTGSGWDVQAQYSDNASTNADDLHLGEKVVVLKTDAFVGETRYIITDKYRLPSVGFLLTLFFLSGIIFAGKKGFTSILGLLASLLILSFYTVPAIVHGAPPFVIACISSFIIAILSLSLAHGFSKQTTIALMSTLITLTLSLGLSQFFVYTAKLFGLGTEDAYTLSLAGLSNIDLRGLLLAGIIIGILGVLDDVTTAQTATIKNLAAAGIRDFKKLYHAGIDVGKEHIVSLVNTLALAYVGASLPLLLLFSVNDGHVPYWIILNGQMITEEIVRTLVGSTALILAVPISTLCAAWFYTRTKHPIEKMDTIHTHQH
ncbi:YibE/F family protein [Candidatus Uhrbacteria bacterium]|nr:YibE/F family protein [Candidatus Uhrbacteria bacterium]